MVFCTIISGIGLAGFPNYMKMVLFDMILKTIKLQVNLWVGFYFIVPVKITVTEELSATIGVSI